MSLMRVHFLDSSSSSEDENGQEHYQQNRSIRRRKIYRDRINFDFFLESSFIERFRVRRATAEHVLKLIGPKIQHKTKKNHALDSKQQILVALHFFGNGSQYHGISDMHGIHKSTVCRIIHRVSKAILGTLFHEYVRWPENSAHITFGFWRIAGFPGVAGAVDGTLVPIEARHLYEKDYVDRHGQHSINAMVVCGPNHEFFYASARWPGSVHDNRVLRNSSLFQKWEIEGHTFFSSCLMNAYFLIFDFKN